MIKPTGDELREALDKLTMHAGVCAYDNVFAEQMKNAITELEELREKNKEMRESFTRMRKDAPASCGIMSPEDTYCVKHGYSKCP